MSELAKALLAFQKDAPEIQSDSINPHFKNRYPSLLKLFEKVNPKLNALGLIVLQFPTTVGNGGDPRPALRTRIEHAESGEFLEDVMLLMPGKEDPQGQGSAITYARRYSLMAALGLVADEDDDGHAASTGTAGRGHAGGSPRPAAPFSEYRPNMTEEQYLRLVAYAEGAEAKPSDQVVHFGKMKGVMLGEMTPEQVSWWANEWKVQDEPSDYDHRLKQAALALHAGKDEPGFSVST